MGSLSNHSKHIYSSLVITTIILIIFLTTKRALSFLNNDGNLRHNNVCVWSVFVNSSGEWKLGSLEYVSPADGNPMPPFKVSPALEVYDPPEKNDQSKLKAATKWYAIPY